MSISAKLETVKFLSLDECKRLFKAIESKRDRAIFLTAYRHGLQASEVGLLGITTATEKFLTVL